MRRPLVPAVLLVVALVAVPAGCSRAQTLDTRSDDGYYGAVLTDQYVVPAVTLTDTSDAPYDLRASTTAPLTLFFFGYTHCPDTCPAVLASIAGAMTRLDDDQRQQVSVVFVTTDPARDDEGVLRHYLDRFDPSFEGLTGSLDTISTLGDAMGVFIQKGQQLPTGGYDVSHGTQVVAVDAHDRSPIVWTEGTSSAQFASDIIRLLDDPLEDQ
ncbi:MAG TPA: SCO family protein [Nocardioides sp.]